MILDNLFNFGIPSITNSTTPTASTNVLDLGSAKKLITMRDVFLIAFKSVLTADASPTIKVDFIGTAQSDLDQDDSEGTNFLLGSSGVIAYTEDGTAIVSGETVERHFAVFDQTVAKRYYGCIITLGGTNPDCVAATSWCRGMLTTQTNLRGARAAVPA